MKEGLFVIVSKVPERISQFTSSLRSFTTDFKFFSDLSSFLHRQPYNDIRLIVLDNVDNDLDIIEHLNMLRQSSACSNAVILVVVKQGGDDTGVQALYAGANDYLAYSVVDKELVPRARLHLNASATMGVDFDIFTGFDDIYPLEDRFIIKSALWYITNSISTLKSVSDLSVCVGKSEKEINRVFSTHVGETAFSYMRSFRINKAKELLAKTRFSITRIALEVGYSSSANFSTAFKSVVGVNPRAYRSQTLLN